MKEEDYLIKNIAGEMFIENSEHLRRLEKFGKILATETIKQRRQFIELIIKQFGDERLNEIKLTRIEKYLLDDSKHSGSWKNFYLETFGSIYDESVWKCPEPVQKPHFQRFARNSRKPDVFTEKELKNFFQRKHWDSETERLLFYMAATCGLRLGEVRAIRKCQIRDREGILIVDGFMKRTGERTCFNKKGSISDRKIRCVPIPESTLKEIRSYTEKKKLSKDEYLFLNEIGCVYTAGHLERTFRQVLGRSGIETKGKRYVPHSLRFTYVTRMRTMFSVEDVRKIAGHASSEMTEYYTRMAISDMCRILQPAREIVNELFS